MTVLGGKQQKMTFNIIDYILVAIRFAGPNELTKMNEPRYKLYRAITKILLNRNAPTQMFRNKVLLAPASAAAKHRSVSKKPSGQISNSSWSPTI